MRWRSARRRTSQVDRSGDVGLRAGADDGIPRGLASLVGVGPTRFESIGSEDRFAVGGEWFTYTAIAGLSGHRQGLAQGFQWFCQWVLGDFPSVLKGLRGGLDGPQKLCDSSVRRRVVGRSMSPCGRDLQNVRFLLTGFLRERRSEAPADPVIGGRLASMLALAGLAVGRLVALAVDLWRLDRRVRWRCGTSRSAVRVPGSSGTGRAVGVVLARCYSFIFG